MKKEGPILFREIIKKQQNILNSGKVFIMKNVLLAGVTGYLGGYIAKDLQKKNFIIRAIARNTTPLKDKNIVLNEIVKAELTKPDTIKGCCKQIDVVISTVGITRQKDGLTYMDVDYQQASPIFFFYLLIFRQLTSQHLGDPSATYIP